MLFLDSVNILHRVITSEPWRPCSRSESDIFARRHRTIWNRMRPPSKQCRGKWSEEGDNGFHASPFALRMASLALRIAVCQSVSSHSVPRLMGSRSPIARSIISRHESTAESKSGAEAIRFALARFPLWRAQISLLPCLMMPQVGSCFQGPGVWSGLFIFGWLVGVLWRGYHLSFAQKSPQRCPFLVLRYKGWFSGLGYFHVERLERLCSCAAMTANAGSIE